MLDIIDEFFYDIDKKENEKKKINLDVTKEEALESFLKEIELYLGDYAKERTIKSSEEILDLCSEYEDILTDEDIFYYYRAYGEFLDNNFKDSITDIEKAISMDGKAFEYYILRGKAYEKLRNETESIISFLKALEINPKSLDGLKRLGFVYMSIASTNEALLCFEKAYVLEKEDHEIYSGLAGCYFEEGDIEKALEYITKAIVLEGNNANYYYNRAIIHRMLGLVEKSVTDYKKTIKIEPGYHIAYFYLADLYIQLKEIEEAREILEVLIAINDKYADAYMKLSYCQLIDNKFDDALESISKAISLEKDNTEYYYKRAAIYRALDEDDLALEDYLNLVELDNKNPYIYDLIGKIYMDREEFEIAIEFLKKGLFLETTESFYGNIAICNYHLEKFELARENFTKSIELSSQSIAEDYFFRGKCSYYLKDGDLGKVDFLKTLEIGDEESTGALYYLSYIAYTNSEFEEVIKYVNEYLEAEDDDYMLLRMISASYSELSEYEKAREVLFRAEKISDGLAELYNDIALSYFNQDMMDKSLEYYDKAEKIDPSLAIIYSNRALVKEAIKDYKSAIKDYKKAIKISDDISYYFGIANCYENLDKRDKALSIYNELLEQKEDNIIVLGEIAWIYHKKGEYKIALEFYDRALMKEDNIYIKVKKLKLLFDTEQNEELIKESKKVIKSLDSVEFESIKYELMTNMAVVYMKVKKVAKAIEVLEKCLDYEPIKQETLKKLIDIYIAKKDKTKVNHYRTMLKY